MANLQTHQVIRYVAAEGEVCGESREATTFFKVQDLVPRLRHFYAPRLGFVAARYCASIVASTLDAMKIFRLA